jgi:hypothetical protein
MKLLERLRLPNNYERGNECEVKCKSLMFIRVLEAVGAGCGTRTHDLGIMRPSLYL